MARHLHRVYTAATAHVNAHSCANEDKPPGAHQPSDLLALFQAHTPTIAVNPCGHPSLATPCRAVRAVCSVRSVWLPIHSLGQRRLGVPGGGPCPLRSSRSASAALLLCLFLTTLRSHQHA